MSYSGAEPAELLAFRARLCGLSTEAPSIQSLSALMRSPTDLNIRIMILRIWLSDVQSSSDSKRLLALIYLANDVIQLLGGKDSELAYRYYFAAFLAQAIVAIRQKAPELIPNIDRVLSIFSNRAIYDSQVLALLQQSLREDLDVVLKNVIPVLKTETTTPQQIIERLKILEKEIREKHQTSITRTTTPTTTQISQPHRQQQQRSQQFNSPRLTISGVPQLRLIFPPPPLDDLIRLGRNLENRCCYTQRPQHCVNFDSEILSRFRGHLALINANPPIGLTDSRLIKNYKDLLEGHKKRRVDLQDKIDRRKKEEEKGHFVLLLANRSSEVQQSVASAGGRVEVLMKKEYNARLQECEIEHAIYWKLVEILDFLRGRWKRIQSICDQVDTENSRRSLVPKSEI